MFSQLIKYPVRRIIFLLGLLLAFYLTNFPVTTLYFFSFVQLSTFVTAWIYSQYTLPTTDGVRGYFRAIAFLFCCLISVKNLIMLYYYWGNLDTKLMIITMIGCLPLAILIMGIFMYLVGSLRLRIIIEKKEKKLIESFRIAQDSSREGDKND